MRETAKVRKIRPNASQPWSKSMPVLSDEYYLRAWNYRSCVPACRQYYPGSDR